jgi:ketosteroid isomerase-like protein
MQTESMDSPWREAMEMEEARQQAMLSGDIAGLANLFADDAAYTHSSGTFHDKEGYLKALAEREFVYKAVELHDRHFAVVDDAVLIFGRSVHDVVFKSGAKRLESRFLSVWVRQHGAWRHVAWQSTPIPATSTVSSSRQ